MVKRWYREGALERFWSLVSRDELDPEQVEEIERSDEIHIHMLADFFEKRKKK